MSNSASKDNKFTYLTKLIGSILIIVGFISGGVLYFESTYMHKAEAEEMRVKIEIQAVSTFKELQQTLKQQQQILDLEQKMKEHEVDRTRLEDLECRKLLMEKEVERNPNDTLLKDKLRRVIDLKDKLENKLYQ